MLIWRKSKFLLAILLLQALFCMTVVLDLRVARESIGFLFLTFLPGFVIVRLLKLRLGVLEKVLFSLGLSIAFLMLVGLLVNQIGPVLGISDPLSPVPLMVTLNGFIAMGAVITSSRTKNVGLFCLGPMKGLSLSLIFLILPVLSIIGAMWVNTREESSILLLMIALTALMFVAAVMSKKFLSPRLYPLVLAAIAISLLYHSTLVSKYIWAGDVHLEYYIFTSTKNSGRWISAFAHPGDTLLGRMNSMLSITVLPTIYSSLLNLDQSSVLKILYPLIFACVPVALYQLWQKHLGKKEALMAAFLVIANMTFYDEMLGLTRQMIAELFLALLLLLILSKEIQSSKITLFMFFSFALITSHYGLAEIFLFFVLLVWGYLTLTRRPSKQITATMIAFFLVTMFSWYVYTSNSAVFDTAMSFGRNVIDQLGQFLNPASRGVEVLRGLGLEAAPTTLNIVSRVFSYLTEFLIMVGFIGLMKRPKNARIEKEFFLFILVALALLAALVLVPGLAETMRMARFYHVLLFLLAPLFVLGGEALAKLITKKHVELVTSILLLTILVPYFLFQTGFIYEISGSQSWSLSLSKYRMDKVFISSNFVYVEESSVVGARWISDRTNLTHTKVYGDFNSFDAVLESYGGMYRGDLNILSNITTVAPGGIIFFSKLNVVYGKVVGENDVWNYSDFSSLLEKADRIYSNGGSDVYFSVEPQ